VPPIVVLASAMFAYAIIAEATLSFLGLGTQPPTPDWGEMVSSGRSYMDQAYWAVLFPALAIMVFVVAVNFVGDGIRDLLDPRYRQRFGPGESSGS
jgi:peptide/nickel transport system permease protein